jgi:hypothetical protein
MEARLDPKTQMSCMPCVPRDVVESFSKRSRDVEAAAREQAAREGHDWDSMDGSERVRWLRASVHPTRRPKADELADVFAWRKQAEALGYRPVTFEAYGPPPPPVPDQERLHRSYKQHCRRSPPRWPTAPCSTDRMPASPRSGLIEHGIKDTADIDAITRVMAKEGVEQDGRRTGLLWRVSPDGRVRITTVLHKEQEQELISLARAAANDRSLALIPARLHAAIARSHLDFKSNHGQAQRAAIEQVGQQGGLAVMIGAAGVGKTSSAAVLVDAWRAAGFTVYGTALAWRQATALRDAGIDADKTRAIEPFLKAVHRGRITLDDKSVVVLDELGQIGTRQLLTCCGSARRRARRSLRWGTICSAKRLRPEMS